MLQRTKETSWEQLKASVDQGSVSTQNSRWDNLKRQAWENQALHAKSNNTAVNNWGRGVSALEKSVLDYYSGDGYRAPNEGYAKELEKYLKQADSVGTSIYANKGLYEDVDAVLAEHDKAVSRLQELKKYVSEQNEYLSKFDDEDSYNKAMEDIKYTRSALAADQDALQIELDALRQYKQDSHTLDEYLLSAEYPEEAKKLDQRLRSMEAQYGVSRDTIDDQIREKESFLYDATRLQGLAALEAVADPESESYDPEFEKKSQYTPQEYTPMSNMAVLADNYEFDGRYPWQDPLYEAINGNTQAQAWLKNKAAGQVPEDNALGRIFYRVAEGKHELLQMEDSEKQIYNYYANGGDSKAREYYDLLETDLYARQRLADYKAHTAAARANPWGESLASIATSPLKGLSYLGQLDDYLDDGKIDENAPYNKFSYHISDTRGAVAQKIEEGNWGKVGSWLYQQGMGMGDFLMSAAVTGGNQVATLAIMGSGAAADMTIDAKKRGLGDDQAIALGTIAGASEVITEKIGLDALFDTALRGKSPVTYLLKNAFSEGLEEPTSSLINLMADVIISKDKSQWQQSIQAYKDQGCDDTKAFWKAVTDQAASLGLDALGGLLSGSAIGGGSVAINSVAQSGAYRQVGKDITASEGGIAALQALAAELGKSDADLAKLSSKISDKVAKGDTRQVGRLYAAVQGAVERSDTTALTNKLIEKGYETQTARRVAQVLMEARSSEVTSQEQAELLKALRGDETVMAAFSEALESEDSAGYRLGKLQEMMRRGASEKMQEGGRTGTQAVPYSEEAAENEAMQTQEEAPEAAVQKAVENLKLDTKVTTALAQGYSDSGLTAERYIRGIQDAYAYGQNQYSYEELSTGANTSQLSSNVRENVYFFGRRAALAQNQRRPHINGKPVTRVNSKEMPARKRGFVKAYGVTVRELNNGFNDAQGHAYGILNRLAEITGIDIVLFKSKKDASGKLRGGIVEGIDMNDSQGAFSWHNDKIYIDVNAGVLTEKELGDVAKYSMLRTFSHEFTHFIEKHNPVEYANFRELVFETMRQNGHDPEAMIDAYMQQDQKLDREAASREVVAEAMTDILPESSFVEQLAQKHKNLFQTLLDKLKAFIESIKDHFSRIGYNRAEEAQALKRQEDGVMRYAEDIVAMFDKIAVQAVERYQEAQKAEKNTAQTDGGVQMQKRLVGGKQIVWIENSGFTNSQLQDPNVIAKYIAGHIGDVYRIIESGQSVYIGKDLPGEYTHSDYTSYLKKKKPATLKAKNKAASSLGEMIEIATNRRWEKTKHSHNKDAKYGMYRYDTQFAFPIKDQSGNVISVKAYDAELLIRNASDGKKYLYDILNIKEDTASALDLRHKEARKGSYKAATQSNVSTDSIRNSNGNVNNNSGQQNQKRSSTLTNRDILAETPDGAAQNDMELKYLRQYREQLDKVQEQEQKQRDLTEQLEALEDGQEERRKELQFELTRTKNRLDILSKRLKKTENAKPMEALIQREASRILTELRKEYGTIPQGENAVRDDALPVSTDGKNRVSRTARSAKGAEVTPDEFAGLIDAKVAKGELTYLPISNDETTQKAVQYIQEEGWETARIRWSENVRQGKANAEMSAIGALLLNNAAQAGDRNAWLEILADYRLMGTRAAQAVQALRILKTLEPSDQLWMVQKSVEKMVKDLHLEGEVQIDSSLIDEYNAATTDKQRDSVISKIQRDVAQQLPSTMMEMWTALRYINMLGNLKTQGRNILGNVASLATHTVKDANAAILESIAAKLSKGEFKRTKSLTVSRELLSACKADFADVESLALDGGKYADVATSRLEKGIRDQKRVFKAPASVKNEKTRRAIDAALTPLEWYRKATSTAMEKGDLWFSRSAYAMSLAGYLKANGVKETDLSKVDAALLDEARAYAIREAQEVTFRDHNALTEILSSKFAETSVVAKAANAAAQGIMPFRQTPANVLLRAEEYSPLGIVNSLVLTLQAAAGKTTLAQKNGLLGAFAKAGQQITGAQLINSFAKTFTGTGLTVLGMIFSNLGWAVGGPEDDDQKEKFDRLNGKQNYAIVFGDASYTFDWLAPSAIPFFMGVTMMENFAENGISVESIRDALMSITDPMIQMSMMQGLNRALDEIRYSENSGAEFGENALISYLLQGITNTLLSQIERGLEDKRYTTYTDKNMGLSTDAQYKLGQASAKIPGWDYNQIPYINAWGEEEKNPGVTANLAYNLLSPGYFSKDTTDAVAMELYRLNEVNESDRGVFPSTPNKTVTFTDNAGVKHEDYDLSAEEYVALARAQGQKQRQIVEKMVTSVSYKSLSDADKVKAVQRAYDYAREYAQIKVLNRDGFSSKWMSQIKGDVAVAIVQRIKDQ